MAVWAGGSLLGDVGAVPAVPWPARCMLGGRSTNKGSACKSSARTWTTSLSLPQARVSFAFFTTLFREIWARFERKSAKFGPFSPKFRCERNLGAFQTKLWPRAITVSKTPVYYESVQLACTSSQFAEILLETPQEHFSACWRWRRWRGHFWPEAALCVGGLV